jgi:hypothetical protein
VAEKDRGSSTVDPTAEIQSHRYPRSKQKLVGFCGNCLINSLDQSQTASSPKGISMGIHFLMVCTFFIERDGTLASDNILSRKRSPCIQISWLTSSSLNDPGDSNGRSEDHLAAEHESDKLFSIEFTCGGGVNGLNGLPLSRSSRRRRSADLLSEMTPSANVCKYVSVRCLRAARHLPFKRAPARLNNARNTATSRRHPQGPA